MKPQKPLHSPTPQRKVSLMINHAIQDSVPEAWKNLPIPIYRLVPIPRHRHRLVPIPRHRHRRVPAQLLPRQPEKPPLRKAPVSTNERQRSIHTPPGYRSQEGPFPWL